METHPQLARPCSQHRVPPRPEDHQPQVAGGQPRSQVKDLEKETVNAQRARPRRRAAGAAVVPGGGREGGRLWTLLPALGSQVKDRSPVGAGPGPSPALSICADGSFGLDPTGACPSASAQLRVGGCSPAPQGHRVQNASALPLGNAWGRPAATAARPEGGLRTAGWLAAPGSPVLMVATGAAYAFRRSVNLGWPVQ